MRKLKKYKPTRFMAKTSHYDKDAADYAVMFIESLLSLIHISSNLYMRICLEGYDTFCFDKNVLVDAYDKCREVCGYEG